MPCRIGWWVLYLRMSCSSDADSINSRSISMVFACLSNPGRKKSYCKETSSCFGWYCEKLFKNFLWFCRIACGVWKILCNVGFFTRFDQVVGLFHEIGKSMLTLIKPMPPGIVRCHHHGPHPGTASFMMPQFVILNFKPFIAVKMWLEIIIRCVIFQGLEYLWILIQIQNLIWSI